MGHRTIRAVPATRRQWLRVKQGVVLLCACLLLGLGGVAVAQPGGQNGHGGAGSRPPQVTNGAAQGPQPAMPPGLAEATKARAAAEARGERIPMRVWDPNTGDMMRHPDGSYVLDTELAEPALPPAPPCESAPGGCKFYDANGREVNPSQPPSCVAAGRCKK